MRVDVDFLNPIVDSVKKTSRDMWRQLPVEVQRTLPYVAVSFTTGLIVYKWQHRKYVLEVRSRLRRQPETQKRPAGKAAAGLRLR